MKLISISTYLLLCGSVGLLRLDQVRSVGVAVGVSVRVAVGVAVHVGVHCYGGSQVEVEV